VDFQDMRIELHKDKNIGKVLFIVEGSRTEPYIMTKLFTSILDYQLENVRCLWMNLLSLANCSRFLLMNL